MKKSFVSALAVAFAALLLLAACGQRGPLYLPDAGEQTQNNAAE